MLASVFFFCVFSSLMWLMYSIMYIKEYLHGVSLSSMGMADFALCIFVVVLPVFILWAIFGYVMQFLNSRKMNSNLYYLFKQMKKNQDYTDLIARVMLEAEHGVKDGFILNKFDLFVSDMNELVAEIIYRSHLASNDQIERLWTKVQNGGKWAFGKVVIEISQSQDNFAMRIFEKSRGDNVLAGTILEFCARYLSLVSILEKHDRERIFLNMIETGVFGKVFSIFAPISDEIRKSREVASALASEKKAAKKEEKKIYNPEAEEENKPSLSLKIKNPFKKKELSAVAEEVSEEDEKQTDPLSIALQKSFGSDEENPLDIVIKKDDIRVEFEREEILTTTQKTINHLKKEWEEMQQNEQPAPRKKAKKEEENEDLGYPFAGWVDEENYSK